MTLEEIRELVRNTTSDDWHRLEGDAPTYIGRFIEPESGEPPLTFSSHEARAVLVRDVDVGLAWGLDADPYNEGKGEAWWAPPLAADPQPRDASPYIAEVLYRGQPVDRMEYAVIDNGHGLVPGQGPGIPLASTCRTPAPTPECGRPGGKSIWRRCSCRSVPMRDRSTITCDVAG